MVSESLQAPQQPHALRLCASDLLLSKPNHPPSHPPSPLFLHPRYQHLSAFTTRRCAHPAIPTCSTLRTTVLARPFPGLKPLACLLACLRHCRLPRPACSRIAAHRLDPAQHHIHQPPHCQRRLRLRLRLQRRCRMKSAAVLLCARDMASS